MKQLLTSILLATTLVFSANADTFNGPTKLSSNSKLTNITIYGPANLDQIQTDSITVTGPAEFEDITTSQGIEVTGPTKGKNIKSSSLTVTGPLKVENLSTNSLVVMGPTKLEHSTINGSTTITGPLKAKDSKFNDITVTAGEIELKKSLVKSILVKKDLAYSTQVLTLNSTMVSGDVIFESGQGKIILENGSKIQGTVTGAKISK
jgi:hypothetical protein